MNMSHVNPVFGATERLLKSADSLDFALTNQDKKSASLTRQGLPDSGSLDSVFASTELSTSLFDDWLSGDLHQAGFTGYQDFSSDSDSSNGHSPVLSCRSESPAFGFDSIASDTDLIRSPGFEPTMASFPADSQGSSINLFGNNANGDNNSSNNNSGNSASTTPMLPLTPEAVQQAAAALNIPWSKALEQAVMAQSLLASLPLALPNLALQQQQSVAPQLAMLMPQLTGANNFMPTTATTTSTTTTATAAASLANLKLNHGASINIAHDNAMEISPPCTPISTIAPSLPLQAERAASTAPSTPRLSILSSTQTSLPVSGASTPTVKTMTYKSSYRSASLMKRNREVEEPPSVLDGKDLSEMDEVSLKRAKNTDAARRSRYKKMVRMEGLEQRVAELEVENSMFESKLNEVELERSLLADKDQMQQARIQELEAMLASIRERLY
ncbi:hypothetical protein BGZ80_004262 [Entomortierella chlamydospora]|uniref:BZIP domain-containing protein n=1 Tax=Entomortierella chlamydospora TaxID=101097 RepID=A0A9P6MMA2_9FUNG|nr:hypothetical protein BGZ80_004262 [Entomortierella chlamydospora]